MEFKDLATNLIKALEAGSYDVKPSALNQGGALQIENLDDVMHMTTIQEDAIFLQKEMRVTKCMATTKQFNRQLSYGRLGGSAQFEGQIGVQKTSDYVRVAVPMAYYAHVRNTTIVAQMVDTFDGVKAEDRQQKDAALNLAMDIEFDSFRGQDDFSNGGVFDGNPTPTVLPPLPGIQGVGLQVRQSDNQRNAKDLMFSEFGSDTSVVFPVGGALTQEVVQDASVRSAMNHGKADTLLLDPIVLGNYNKLGYAWQRNFLSGTALQASGQELQTQFVSTGTAVRMKASRFLSGKTSPQVFDPQSKLTNAGMSVATTTPNTSTTIAGVVTSFKAADVYIYTATACNEAGEGPACPTYSVTIAAAGDGVVLTITHPTGTGSTVTVRYFNIYRTVAGGAAGTQKYIGRQAINLSGTTTTFTDLNNRNPAFVNGYLIQKDTWEMAEMSPYSRLKLGVIQLAQQEVSFRFATLLSLLPRYNSLLDNLS